MEVTVHDGDHLSEAAVRRVLERTANLDVSLGRTLTVAQLRTVVRDAGFSEASLQVALAELASEPPRETAPHAVWWARAGQGLWRLAAVIGSVATTLPVLFPLQSFVHRIAGASPADAVAVGSILLALGIGHAVARRLGTMPGRLLTAGLALAVIVDTAFEWSGFLVNGRSAKFAEMAAAVVGVTLGMWLTHSERRTPLAPSTDEVDSPAKDRAGLRMPRVWFTWRPRSVHPSAI